MEGDRGLRTHEILFYVLMVTNMETVQNFQVMPGNCKIIGNCTYRNYVQIWLPQSIINISHHFDESVCRKIRVIVLSRNSLF